MLVSIVGTSLIWLLAIVGVAAILIAFMLATPLGPPQPLPLILEGGGESGYTEIPDLSRFQARDGPWLAYRLYPASGGARDSLAILAHGSSALSNAMNGVAR